VLHGLGVDEELAASGILCRRYEIADHRGRLLRAVDLDELTAGVGPMILTSRAELVRLLRRASGDLAPRAGTTLERLEPRGERVRAVLSDGDAPELDLVVGFTGSTPACARSLSASPRSSTRAGRS